MQELVAGQTQELAVVQTQEPELAVDIAVVVPDILGERGQRPEQHRREKAGKLAVGWGMPAAVAAAASAVAPPKDSRKVEPVGPPDRPRSD